MLSLFILKEHFCLPNTPSKIHKIIDKIDKVILIVDTLTSTYEIYNTMNYDKIINLTEQQAYEILLFLYEDTKYSLLLSKYKDYKSLDEYKEACYKLYDEIHKTKYRVSHALKTKAYKLAYTNITQYLKELLELYPTEIYGFLLECDFKYTADVFDKTITPQEVFCIRILEKDESVLDLRNTLDKFITDYNLLPIESDVKLTIKSLECIHIVNYLDINYIKNKYVVAEILNPNTDCTLDQVAERVLGAL